MIITSKHFGRIEFDRNKIMDFPEGVIGFPSITQFILVNEVKTQIKWLISAIEDCQFEIPMIDTIDIDGYSPEIMDENDLLQIGAEGAVSIYATITVSRDVSTANLKAPITINIDKRRGIQTILYDEDYQMKYPIEKPKIEIEVL